MRILFISEYYPPKIMGGGEINLAQIAQELAKTQEVTVLTSFFPGLAREEAVAGVKILRRLKTGTKTSTLAGNFIRRFSFPGSVVRETRKIIAGQNPDLIHFLGTSVIAAPKIKQYHQKLFATVESYPALCPKGDRLFHGKEECTLKCAWKDFTACQKKSSGIGKMRNRWYLKYNPLFLWMTYRYYQRLNKALSSCHLIAISNYVQNLLQQHHLESTVIPNAFDPAPFAAMKKNNNGQKKPVVLYAGALIESKGPLVLLEAMKGIDSRCELYGEGILKEELQRYIHTHHLDAEIFPPRPYEKMPEIYARADVIVFPSLWPEPFGRVPLEALAAGKPIVASNSGAIPEVAGNTGILFSPGNSRELQEAIAAALTRKREVSVPLSAYAPSAVTRKLIQAYQS